MNFKNTLVRCVLALLCLFLSTGSGLAEAASDGQGGSGAMTNAIEKFMTDGKAYLDGRYRFEYVDQDGIEKNAKASTLRSRLGFTSGSLLGLRAKVEVEDVTEIGNDNFNNTINGRDEYPVVADVEGTEINEAHLSLEAIPDTVLRGGREALKLDNLRFVGDVGWRQNNQTFDGVNLTNKSIEDLKLFYAFFGKVNRIFGEDSPNGEFDTNSHLFNISYTGVDALALTPYIYLFDVEDAPALSNVSYGLRAHGKSELDEGLWLLYDGEYSYQEDYEDNPVKYSANYWRAGAGFQLSSLTISGGFESLGSDDGIKAFSTPFATLHAWNGWADKFLQHA